MDVAALRWFQQVADGTTVTEVSEIEGVTQSGVSRALTRLETEIGTPLLRRAGRTLRMTRAGAAFKRHVDGLLHEFDDGLAAISELTSPDTGTVSVAFQPSLGTWLVPHLVASFAEKHPGVRFDLHQVRDEVAAATPVSAVDVEITTVRSGDATVRWRPLVVEPLQLVVPHEHPLAERASIGLSQAAAHPFVMVRPNYVLRRICEDLCRQAGFTPTVAFEVDDLPTVEGFVAADLGVAIVPMTRRDSTSDTDARLRFLSLTDEGASRQIGIAWSTVRRPLPAAERFRRHVIEQVRGRSL